MTAPRVVLVVGTISGGTGSHAVMLAAGGLAVSVAGPASARPQFTGTAAAFWPVDIGDRPRLVADLTAVAALRRQLRLAAPDVVHAHGLRAGAFAALALALTGRPRPALLVTVHNAAPSGRAAGAVYWILELIVARRATAVLCASADLVAQMRRRGARDTGQAVVAAQPAARPAEAAVRAARAAIGTGPGPVLLTVARLAAQKGLDVLLDAAVTWQHRDPVPVLAIAGAGPLAGELSARAARQQLAVVLLGHRDDVPALLAAADVVVVPSRWEARALIVQEALRAGKPIVATRVGGIPDLTEPGGALLVPPDDPGALAAAVRSVLDDQELARRLSASARARADALPTESDALTAAVAAYQRLAARRTQSTDMTG